MAFHQDTHTIEKCVPPDDRNPETLTELYSQHAAVKRTYEAQSRESDALLPDHPGVQPTPLTEFARLESSIEETCDTLHALECRIAKMPCLTADEIRQKAAFFLENMLNDSAFLEPHAENILQSFLAGSIN